MSIQAERKKVKNIFGSYLTLSFNVPTFATLTLQIVGAVTQEGTAVESGYQIVITNLNKPQFTKTTTTQTDGTYGEGFFDLTNQVAEPGDVIQTVVKSKNGTTTLGSNTKTYSSGTSITIDVALVPQGTVTLDSGGPPTWTYTLTHISGIVKSWTYTGDGITGATVTGTAATAGWTVGTQTSNSVTFTNTTELTSPVSGFQISGTQGGTGTWTVGDSSGTIDGSLPVELASFTGTLAGNGVRIHWRTETETNNLGFNVYRSRTQEGDYIRITPTLIKGHGTDATPHDYSFLDETAEVGKTYYYYIEDTDFSGKKNKSHIIKVGDATSKGKLTTTWGTMKKR